ELISLMADIAGVEWILLHYAYPTQFPEDLLEVIKNKPNVCKYLDIALQHISDNILQRMRRKFSKSETYQFIKDLRETVPGITLRTTLMVGFPGETDEDFEELVEFVKWARFERMGAFAYSEEDGTYAALHYADDVPDDVKQSRLDRLMAVQQEISEQLAAKEVGKTVRVMVDRKEGDFYVGRTESSSPEVDPEVLIPAGDKTLDIGAFCQVHITASDEFDLYGKAI
ncbi:MAG: radical SAM protein, partial [Prevotella sp.]|nr:radical SAM protein [Prevotella sp.]